MDNRDVNVDLLRVLAMVSVILLHIASTSWAYVEVNSTSWEIYNCFRCMVKWGVNIFVMISGAMLLKKDYSVESIWRKYIKKTIIVLTIWSFIYAVIPLIKALHTNGRFSSEIINEFLLDWANGHTHLWYLYMLLGLYLVMPIIQCIKHNDYMVRYFIIVGFIFTILLPLCKYSDSIFFKIVNIIYNKLSVTIVTGYVLYFLLGYYIYKNKYYNYRQLWAVLFVLIYVFSVYMTHKSNGRNDIVDGTMSIGLFFEAVSIFIVGINAKVGKITKK